jgi:hypothetical protein
MRLRKLGRSIYIVFLMACLMVTVVAQGQPTDPSADPDTVPISGLEILLGAGALLGAKKLLGKKKEQNSL